MPQVLNVGSFAQLLYDCHVNHDFHGVIMVPDTTTLDNLTNQVLELYESGNLPGVIGVKNSMHRTLIYYDNGSIIRCQLAKESRGFRCHRGLYSEVIPSNTIRAILSPMIREYNQASFNNEYDCTCHTAYDDIPSDSEDNSALDDFLREFKVVGV